jgi:hypothetical protein
MGWSNTRAIKAAPDRRPDSAGGEKAPAGAEGDWAGGGAAGSAIGQERGITRGRRRAWGAVTFY